MSLKSSKLPIFLLQQKRKKSYAPYKYEIQMLREQVFNPHMKEQILADAEN